MEQGPFLDTRLYERKTCTFCACLCEHHHRPFEHQKESGKGGFSGTPEGEIIRGIGWFLHARLRVPLRAQAT